jgi:hypothetical protein
VTPEHEPGASGRLNAGEGSGDFDDDYGYNESPDVFDEDSEISSGIGGMNMADEDPRPLQNRRPSPQHPQDVSRRHTLPTSGRPRVFPPSSQSNQPRRPQNPPRQRILASPQAPTRQRARLPYMEGDQVTIRDIYDRRNWLPNGIPPPWRQEDLQSFIGIARGQIAVMNQTSPGFHSRERDMSNYEVWFYSEVLRILRDGQKRGETDEAIQDAVNRFLLGNWEPLFGGLVPRLRGG